MKVCITSPSQEIYPAEVPAESKGIIEEVMVEENYDYQQGLVASYRDGGYRTYTLFH